MMLDMPTEGARKGSRLSEPASGSRCGGDAIKPAIGKKGKRLSEHASGSSAGDAIKSKKLAEGDKAEAGKVKRMGLVSKEYIRRLRNEGSPRIPNFDFLDNRTGPKADLLREIAARSTATMEGLRAHHDDILKQVDTEGRAQVEMEAESWLDDPKLWVVQLARKELARNKMAAGA